jgi:hypothetical protein
LTTLAGQLIVQLGVTCKQQLSVTELPALTLTEPPQVMPVPGLLTEMLYAPGATTME